MKKTLLIPLLTLALALPAALRAQEFRQKFASSQNRKVVLDMRGSNVTVEGYDGDELFIHGSGHYEAPPALANGLRAVYSGGNDNTRLGLSVSQLADNTIRVAHAARSDGHYTVRVPRQTDVLFAQDSWGGGSDDLLMRDLGGHIEASLKSGNIRLLNVSGSVVANTISGNIQVKFGATPTEPSAVSSVSGNVDVTLPAPAKISLSMRSISGEIYTDFDLSLGGSGLHHVGGQTVEGRANGGGTTLSLKTISGDIFVRKAK